MFILNDRLVTGKESSGLSLLSFIRERAGLKGTKSGCREGDCGACTVLEGQLAGGRIRYLPVVSCLYPLGNAHGRHLVTVEGLTTGGLNPVQQALADRAAVQCGFCTPGMVMSLMAWLLSDHAGEAPDPRELIDGNICRCTGYQSILRAARDMVALKGEQEGSDPVAWLIGRGWLPSYFREIPERLAALPSAAEAEAAGGLPVAGGTDLMVQKADAANRTGIRHFPEIPEMHAIAARQGTIEIGAGVTASGIRDSEILQLLFPGWRDHFRLISSAQVRNMGTLGGNLANGSPIADLAVIFLALGAQVVLQNPGGSRRPVPLQRFYKGYRQPDLQPGEFIVSVTFPVTDADELFSFEKVSKREHLDIASVNSALLLKRNGETAERVRMSAGGVAPVPFFTTETCRFLEGKRICPETLIEANWILQQEIAPIGDIRGSAAYKRLLLRQLFHAHFLKFFPQLAGNPEFVQNLTENGKH